MNNRKGRVEARPLVAIHVDGEQYPALLTGLTSERARVQLQGQFEVEEGLLVALAIAGLPTLVGDARRLEDGFIDIEFRSTLHPSVVEFVREALPELPNDPEVS